MSRFWRTAALDVPIVIIGGGRWGRTWASVVAAARGSAQTITIAARTDPEAVRAWAATRADLKGLSIVTALPDAMTRDPRPTMAIVASRPRDHVKDALSALEYGLHLLVEKPLSVAADDGRSLQVAARGTTAVLAVGTEYAYLPVLHQIAPMFAGLGASPVSLCLRWEDVANEIRHGGAKVRHDETGLLQDLLPHAVSIFQVFARGRALRIVAAAERKGGTQGRIQLSDDVGGSYTLLCDVEAAARARGLEIECAATKATLDFGGATSSIVLDGLLHPLDPRLASMTSTLRLELGAFLAVATRAIDATFVTDGITDLLRLQAELEHAAQGSFSPDQA